MLALLSSTCAHASSQVRVVRAQVFPCRPYATKPAFVAFLRQFLEHRGLQVASAPFDGNWGLPNGEWFVYWRLTFILKYR